MHGADWSQHHNKTIVFATYPLSIVYIFPCLSLLLVYTGIEHLTNGYCLEVEDFALKFFGCYIVWFPVGQRKMSKYLTFKMLHLLFFQQVCLVLDSHAIVFFSYTLYDW